MAKGNKPAFFLSARARDATKGDPSLDIGSLFPGRFGYDLALKEGTRILVTHAYDPAKKAVVKLAKPVVVTPETHWFNVTPYGGGKDSKDSKDNGPSDSKDPADKLPF